MIVIPKFFRCNQKARFVVLFLIFSLFFLLNLNHWATLLEFIIASTFIPFFGYLVLTFGRQSLMELYYATKRGETDVQLTSIAKKENSRINKVVIKDVDRYFAYFNRFTNSVILSRKLIETLADGEIEAVLYHETLHGEIYSPFVRVLLAIFFVPAVFIFYLVPCIVVYAIVNLLHPFLNNLSLSFVSAFVFCVFFLISERKVWSMEYNADAKAAKRVGIRTMISALTKITPSGFENCDFPTHPSLNKRIAYLEKQ